MTRVLTGITTTGTPHLGNYVGAIRPAIAASKNLDNQCFLFLADYHALIKNNNAQEIHRSTLEVAATWLACGLDPEQVIFYRQSDISQIPQLMWLLTCMAAKGLLNRAHAYKDAVAYNISEGQDNDYAVTMGLFSYPVLMAADILLFRGENIPVGRDQIQHIEIARDIALRFNHHYGELLTVPKAVVDSYNILIKGIDGRKMSKSYKNTIPLFIAEKALRKNINKIVTNSLEPGQPKSLEDNTVYDLYCCFSSKQQSEELGQMFAEGLAWGESKRLLFELINSEIANFREQYNYFMAHPKQVEAVLQHGARQAQQLAQPLVDQLMGAVGIRSLG